MAGIVSSLVDAELRRLPAALDVLSEYIVAGKPSTNELELSLWVTELKALPVIVGQK